jgi:hypothetical protein
MRENVPSSGSCARCRAALDLVSVKIRGLWYCSPACARGDGSGEKPKPAAAQAVDGVIEINQAKALAGGVTTGDVAGFPVELRSSGSCVRTSDLTVASGTVGIDVSASDVTKEESHATE